MYAFSPSAYCDQGDAGRAVRVVLDGVDLAGTPSLCALEVDDAVHPLVAAAAVPGGDLALVVAAAVFLSGTVRRLLGLLVLSVISAKSLTDALRRPGLVGL